MIHEFLLLNVFYEFLRVLPIGFAFAFLFLVKLVICCGSLRKSFWPEAWVVQPESLRDDYTSLEDTN